MSTTTRTNYLTTGAVLALMIFGSYIRLINLDNNPPGLWQDEASTGLDAYLLWTTGRDRAGAFLPVIARSFGDYPLTLYRYLTAPIVGLFGLTIGNERLVAALAGVSLLLSTYVFTRFAVSTRVALCALLSGVLTPTWIHFSRYGSEAMLLPATMVAALALIELARAKDRWWLAWVAGFVLGGAAYTYHAVKLFLPLWMVPFLWYQWPLIRALWTSGRRKHVVGPAAVFVLSVLPSMIVALTPEGMARGRTVAAWTHYHGEEVVRLMINNYLGYFEPTMLFINGGPAVAQSIPGIGIWSAIDLPLMVVGLTVIARTFREHRVFGLLVAWLILGPIPGGITYETHNIGRVIGWLPSAQIISGVGMAATVTWAQAAFASRERLRTAAAFALLIALVAGWASTAVMTTKLTLIRYPIITERDWQFEPTRALLCAKRLRGDRKIVVSPAFAASEIFALFHLSELPTNAQGEKQWSIATRAVISADEIYALPASEPQPSPAEVVCEVKQRSSGETKAWVLAAKPIAPGSTAAPVVDGGATGTAVMPALKVAPRLDRAAPPPQPSAPSGPSGAASASPPPKNPR